MGLPAGWYHVLPQQDASVPLLNMLVNVVQTAMALSNILIACYTPYLHILILPFISKTQGGSTLEIILKVQRKTIGLVIFHMFKLYPCISDKNFGKLTKMFSNFTCDSITCDLVHSRCVKTKV